MATLDKISVLVQNQLPDFYKEEGPNFVAFIEAYYEYLEQNGKLTDAIRNLQSYRDINTTTDEFIQYFINTFLPNVPLDVVADKKLLTKYIRLANISRGTLASYKLLFRALYNEELEVSYPADQILKVSDGDWRRERYLVSSYDEATYNFIGKTIKGQESRAEALVEDIVRKVVNGRDIMQILLSNVKGTFNNLEPIRLLSDTSATSHSPIVEAGISNITILAPGAEYREGDVVGLLSNLNGDFGKIVVTEIEDLGGVITFSIDDGGSGYTASQGVDSGTIVNVFGGDGIAPASFVILPNDITDTFALALNTDLFSSNNIYGDQAVTVADGDGVNVTMSTLGNVILSSPDYGFREQGDTLTSGVPFYTNENAILRIANTSDPLISASDTLYGVTSGANAIVNEVIRAHNGTDVILRIDGYKNFTSTEKVNISTVSGTTVGTVTSFSANAIGSQIISVGNTGGETISVGDELVGLTSGAFGLVRRSRTESSYSYEHIDNGPTLSGTISSSANTVTGIGTSFLTDFSKGDRIVSAGSSLSGTISSSANTVTGVGTSFLTDFSSGDLIISGGQTQRVFSVDSDTQIITTGQFSPVLSGATYTLGQAQRVFSVDSDTQITTAGQYSPVLSGAPYVYGGEYRTLLSLNVSANSSSNLTSQFDSGPMAGFLENEGIRKVGSVTVVANSSASSSNTEIENIYSRISDALNFEATTFGTIAQLSLIDGGTDYSIAPTVSVIEPNISALGIGEQYLTLQWDDVNLGTANSQITILDTNDRIEQLPATADVKGGLGSSTVSRIQFANGTYQSVVRAWQPFNQRAPGNISFANNASVTLKIFDASYVFGETDTRTPVAVGTAKIVSIQDEGILGQNATITPGVGANGTVTAVRVVDSGFAYRDNEIVLVEAASRPLAQSARVRLNLGGVANSEGYYATSRSHVSTKRGFIQDSRFYQEFSYQVISPISLDRYRDIALQLVHPAGQALFGKFRLQSNANLDVVATADNRTRLMSNGTITITKTVASGTIAITNDTTRVTGTSTDFLNEFGSKSVSGSVVVHSGNTTVIGTGTTFTNYKSGDLLRVGDNKYTIATIANNNVMSVLPYNGLNGASSNSNYTINGANSFIVEIDTGNDIPNQFIQVGFSANTATNVVLDDKWVFDTQTSANVYYANTYLVTGTTTDFSAEFANGDTMIIETDSRQFVQARINKVISDTQANLSIAWTGTDLSGANAYYYNGDI